MFDKINAKVSIGFRLALISVLFLAATGFVTTLMISNALGQINFSAKEKAGTEYLVDVWDAVRSGGRVDVDAAGAFNAEGAAQEFQSAQGDARLDAGVALIIAIADGSNLTLDPDLDSYYAMDAVAVKLPALLQASREVERVAASSGANREVNRALALNGLENAVAAANSSLEASIASNGDGITARALSEMPTSIEQSGDALIAAARWAAPGADVSGAADDFTSEVDAAWRATAFELERLLDVRIAGMRSQMMFQLAMVAAFLVAAGAVALLVTTGLVGRFKALTGAMDKLREGDFKIDVPYVGDGHETGKIAQTLEFLRDDMGKRVEEDARRLAEAQRGAEGMIKAISRSQAMIEFELDGTIINANENFLGALGYTLDEIKGQHHSMFVDPALRQSPEYREFWARLGRGEFDAGKYKRFGKGGREIWIRASYNPILDENGRPFKVVKFASDITESEREFNDLRGKTAAIGRSQAVIEFKPDGTILDANQNFLNAMGYTIEEIRGKHHSMFADPKFAQSAAYQEFWARLGRGEFDAGKYKRFGKGGKEIWIRASYNPILDDEGKTIKVVKFASDITASELAAREASFKGAAFGSSSMAMMMINRDFEVTYVNDSTMQLLRDNADAFRQFWPNFDPEKIIGQCIDQFHKNPAHQRQMLSDPARLPYRTDIAVGDLRFALSVGAVYDENGDYAGNTLEWDNVTTTRSNAGVLAALDRAQAVIEFDLTGKIITANQNFLDVMGYRLEEIVGKHHSMFAEAGVAQTAEYKQFWEKLGRGESDIGKYKRVGKGGKEVWIQASYNAILDGNGKAFKVVKLADDVTALEHERTQNEAERARRSQELSDVVASLADGLGRLSDGDLTHRVEQSFPEEYERLRVDFNRAMSNLQDAMRVILQNAAGINSGSSEISQAADDLSKRTEQQAASLEQTAAALDEITATVKKTAEGAGEANSVGKSTRDEAEKGGAVVSEAVSAMSEIESSAEQISQIIGVIDEIAFQTNLLALNAGVEAARAGEAGRGFAVVASEVRALAQRSSEAAKEIKSLIMTSSQHVASGVDLVGRTGKALTEIVEKVTQMTALVGEIAASADEQATGLSQVNTAVNQMDQVTQQNAAMVEESTAASHSLAGEASALSELVSKFNIGDSSTPAKSGGPAVNEQQARAAQFAKETKKPARKSAAAVALKPQSNLAEDGWEEF